MSLVKKFCMSAGVVAVLTASMASAQTRDAGAKMRGEFGATSKPHSAVRRVGPVYRAPAIVAEAPSGDRTFSYAPAQAPAASNRCGAMNGSVSQPIRQQSAGGRTYSYEPAQPTFSAPRVYSNQPSERYYSGGMSQGRSSTPSYLLPKTDPRRFGGGR